MAISCSRPARRSSGTNAAGEEILAAGNAAQALFPMVDFGDCPVTPPTVTFEERLNVWVDDLKVELIFVGPAHTTNDIVAWVPGTQAALHRRHHL